jgi:tetratricopeptide (TPR) repeat protein
VGARGEMRLGRIRVRALDHGPFPANPDGESVAAYARAAVQFDPDDSHAQLLLAESLLASGKSAEAEAPLEKAKQLLDPQYHHSSGLTYLLGYFEEVHGRYEPAVEHLQLALQIPRLAPGAARRLAWIKATCPVDALRGVAEAQQYLEQCATGSDPDAADYLEIAAAVQAEGGDFSSAVATQRRALEKLTDAASRTSAQERLDLYLQNKPYRVPAVAAK